MVGGWDDVLVAGERFGSWAAGCGTDKTQAQQEGEEAWEDEVETDK